MALDWEINTDVYQVVALGGTNGTPHKTHLTSVNAPEGVENPVVERNYPTLVPPTEPPGAEAWARITCAFLKHGGSEARRGWRLDRVAYERACEHLGLRRPWPSIRSYYGPLEYERLGTFYFGDTRYYIILHYTLPGWYASAAIWHELTHAVQLQSYSNWREYYSELLKTLPLFAGAVGSDAYIKQAMLTGFELEANAGMDKHFTQGSLCDEYHTQA